MHDFQTSKATGEQYEQVLDLYYSRHFSIAPVNQAHQWEGIDRTWTSLRTGMRYAVEYKADSKAAQTGNIFLETVSNDATGRCGWAVTSLSQLMVFYIPPWSRAYICSTVDLKGAVERWQRTFTPRPAVNDTYTTWGICVPLTTFQPTVKWTSNIS